MNQRQVTLGHALAILKYEQNGKHRPDPSKLDTESRKYLEYLQAKISSNDFSHEFPPTRSYSANDLITGLEDHFICCFLLESKNGHLNCTKLNKGLNNSYPCFQEFVEVIRDYHTMDRELGNNLE